MRTLVEVLQRMPALGRREAVRWRSGYRTLRMSYAELYARIAGCARAFDQRGLKRGDRLILWGANAPEWVVVFWACVARGIQVVPIDARSSAAFVRRVQEQVQAKLLVCDQPIDAATLESESDDGTEIVRFEGIAALPTVSQLVPEPVTPDDVVETVFTSGTTGDPKGVVHRHRNICANLTPIAREIRRFRILLRVVGAVRVLDMLPLSHMFGQSLGLYVPVLLGGTSVFTDELSPGSVLETIRRESVTAAAVVPRMLESLQHEAGRRHGSTATDEDPDAASREPRGWMATRIWQHRSVHRALGWRFWFFVVGGAAVSSSLERFWARRGFIVVQGYGLTETSPVVALNHPLRPRRGSIGRVLPGLEVRIAADGEILVRGDSVVSEYWTSRGTEGVAGEERWLHTGDLGELDSEGRLYYRGRKKDVIVVADGMNVHPQDVEAVLNANPEVRDSTVVGVGSATGPSVHAVLILNDPTVDLERLVQSANRRLESHQRIRSWSVWPQPDFPRTLSTAKVKRVEVARAVEAAHAPPSGSSAQPPSNAAVPSPSSAASRASGAGLYDAIAAVAQRDVGDISPDLSLEDDLGLSSLERVELVSALEHLFGVDLDEARLADIDTVAGLQGWIDEEVAAAAAQAASTGRAPGAVPAAAAGARVQVGPGERPSAPASDASAPHDAVPATGSAAPPTRGAATPAARAAMPLPRWRSHWPLRLIRRGFQDGFVVPVFRAYHDLHVEGREHLESIDGPVVFAANHTSHFDTPAVLAALPARWRRRVAPAMMSEYFRGYLHPEGEQRAGRWLPALQFHLACGLFNAFPLPQRMGGIRRVLQYMGEQVDAGACPLVFPEGGRSRDGTLQLFRPGVGLMAVSMQIPVVPLHLRGVFEALPPGQRWPRRVPIRVRIGQSLRFAPDVDHRAAARDVEQAIRDLAGA